jgi:hypothetical protein
LCRRKRMSDCPYNREYNAMGSIDEITGTTEYLALYARGRLNR